MISLIVEVHVVYGVGEGVVIWVEPVYGVGEGVVIWVEPVLPSHLLIHFDLPKY